ncbi:unnamed protein product [Closterium sp. Naga37s-1]|nr:unnamed protein product [Closterium sp. Naga37s-1]
MYVIISYTQRDFNTALSAKKQTDFYDVVFKFIIIIIVAAPFFALFDYVQELLSLEWRLWLTNLLLSRYFANHAFLDLKMAGKLDNPDQRICEDVKHFVRTSLNRICGDALRAYPWVVAGPLLSSLLVAFAYVLWDTSPLLVWDISPPLVWFLLAYAVSDTFVMVRVIGMCLQSLFPPSPPPHRDISPPLVWFLLAYAVSGTFVVVRVDISPPLVWFLLAYAVSGTFVVVRVFGKRLTWLQFQGFQREADLRYSLVRVKDNGFQREADLRYSLVRVKDNGFQREADLRYSQVRVKDNGFQREADLRYSLVRVKDNVESIAFYRGEVKEEASAKDNVESIAFYREEVKEEASAKVGGSQFSFPYLCPVPLPCPSQFFLHRVALNVRNPLVLHFHLSFNAASSLYPSPSRPLCSRQSFLHRVALNSFLHRVALNVRNRLVLQFHLSFFTNLYDFATIFVPAVIVAPRYFSGACAAPPVWPLLSPIYQFTNLYDFTTIFVPAVIVAPRYFSGAVSASPPIPFHVASCTFPFTPTHLSFTNLYNFATNFVPPCCHRRPMLLLRSCKCCSSRPVYMLLHVLFHSHLSFFTNLCDFATIFVPAVIVAPRYFSRAESAILALALRSCHHPSPSSFFTNLCDFATVSVQAVIVAPRYFSGAVSFPLSLGHRSLPPSTPLSLLQPAHPLPTPACHVFEEVEFGVISQAGYVFSTIYRALRFEFGVIAQASYAFSTIYRALTVEFGVIAQAGYAFSTIYRALTVIVLNFNSFSERLDSLLSSFPPYARAGSGDRASGELATRHTSESAPALISAAEASAGSVASGVLPGGSHGEGAPLLELTAMGGSTGGGGAAAAEREAAVIECTTATGRIQRIEGPCLTLTSVIIRAPNLQFNPCPSDPPRALTSLRPRSHSAHRRPEVSLPDLAERVGGLAVECDYSDMLSMGEQQRVAFARLLLQRPYMAFLDEATSALDGANEARLYGMMRERVKSFVSMGHRTSLIKFHTLVLAFDEDGEGWEVVTSEEFGRRKGI